MSNEYKIGYNTAVNVVAFNLGKVRFVKNPYPRGSLERRNWTYGYQSALLDILQGRVLIPHSKSNDGTPEFPGTCGC